MTDAAKNRVIRRAEQIEAARQYGAEVFFLARPDGRLWADDALVTAVRQSLAEFQPEYVLTFDPDYPPRIQHSDHLESGIAGIKAALLVPSVRWILRFSTLAPNYAVDVSKFWDERELLLGIHKSQFFGARLEMVRGMIEERSEAEGAKHGFEEGEAFRCSRGYGSS
jgi:LmbE family N-acetylglucosaminyl deacetylase